MRVLRGIYEPRGIEVPPPLQVCACARSGLACAGQGRAALHCTVRAGGTGAGWRAWQACLGCLCCPFKPAYGNAIVPPDPACHHHAVEQRPPFLLSHSPLYCPPAYCCPARR